MYTVKEQFIQGKKDKSDLCEDVLVIEENVVAVIDGATDKSGRSYDGISSGRFAALTVAESLKKHSDLTLITLVQNLSKDLYNAIQKYDKAGDVYDIGPPTAAMIAWLPDQDTIVRIGDCQLMVNGQEIPCFEKKMDTATSHARALFIQSGIKAGNFTEADLKDKDVGRDYIMPILETQHLHANDDNSPFGFGVLNGKEIPEQFIQIVDVSEAENIVMCSDGYPSIQPTLKEAESVLSELLKNDPMLYKEVFSTKGLQDGQVSFDDRSFVSLSLTRS